jgi:SAM-dependent methyltransferase
MVESIGNFDEYINSYSTDLQKALGGLGGESAYFARRKVQVLAKSLRGTPPSVILDYGSGMGALIPHLREFFPDAQIWATDVSKLSLEHLQKTYPYVRIFAPNEIPPNSCDVVVMSCVLHHIPTPSRQDVVGSIKQALKSGGSLCVFEHNPINPVTRKIVSNCVFDEGVELIQKRSLKNLILRTGGFTQQRAGYFIFFPPRLKALAPLEEILSWLPLGGQHFSRFTNSSGTKE